MDIFRALKDENAPETYLQSLLRKGVKRDIPYIVNIHLSDEIQRSLRIEFSTEGLSLDRPWKTVPKGVLLKHVKKFKDKSPFYPFADNLKMLRDSEVLIGLDTSNLKNLTNYYICVTQEGKTAVLEELKAMHKRIMDYINNSFTKEPGSWEALGSEEELKADVAVNNRPLISYEWVGNKIDRMNRLKPLNFSELDADSNAQTHCSIIDRGRSKYKLVEAVAVHTYTQVAPKMTDAPAQTIPEIPMNASTQFNPEIDAQEKEERIQNQAPLDENVLAEQLKRQYDKIMSALTYNGEYDLYKDDYEYLVKEGKKSGVVATQTYVHFLTLVNTMCDPNKYITCTAWHPGLCGTVAVAYGDSVIFRNEEIQSDSDDSDYEVKPSKPEEHIPKIDPLLLASEVVEAALWKASCHEMLENFDKKEDLTNYKLGKLTILFLEHAQRVRDREIYLEKKYEESRPELEEMEFAREFLYEDYEYDEESYNPEEDLIYKFRLDEYSSVPPDSDAPEETSIVKFEDLVRPFLEKDSVPIIQEPKTLSIVWDMNNWILGYSLKEEATVVHRRHFMQALVDGGPLLEIPRPKTYCPFLRVKRTGYRVHTTGKGKKQRKSLMSRGSAHRRPSIKRSSTISKSSDSVSISSLTSNRSRISIDKKKKQRPKYIEVSDDEEMERHAKEYEIVETGPTHSIYIWSIHNDLEPLLKLVSPYEVSAMNFSPHNGDLLAAGTISGQIVLWDLQGKLLQRDESEPSNFERYARKELKRRMGWYRELRVPGQLRETAVSTMSGAHNSKVISIHWVHPQLVFQHGHFDHIQAEGDIAESYSLQFLSTSLDGDIKCWDLKSEPLPKNDYMFAERTIARKIKNPKPELLVSLTSKYTEYHNRWIPTYTLKEPFTENAKGVKSQCSLLASSVQFHTKLYPYKRKYPADPRFKDKMTDLVEYQFNPQPKDFVTYSQTAFIGTMFGVVALLSWNGQPPNPKPNEPTDSETLDITVMAAVHDGPIIGVLRHPFISDVALSVGGHVWAIWNFVEMTWPIKWKRYYGKQITCCSWSPLKPSLFRIGLTDGTVEIWDLILQSHEPKVVIPAAGVGITGFSSHNLPLPKGLMGACDMNASIVFYYIPWIYQSWRKHELEALKEMLAKEPERHRELNQWAADWRETHVRLNKKLNEQTVTSSVKVDLHEDDSDDEAKKKKMKDADDNSIFKIGHFEPRKNVPPRDCKAYYRELYKWYLRRRGRTTRLMEEKERKWYEEEERAIIKDLLKNKRIDLNQLQKTMIPLVQNENRLKAKEGRVIAMLAQADKIFKTAVSKIFNVVNYQVSYASKDSLIEHQEASKLDGSLKEIEFYFGPRHEDAEQDLQAKLTATNFTDRSFEELVQEKMKKRELFNDRRRFWDPEEKWMRILARNIIEENGFICGQWEPHELTYEYRKYAYRQKNIDEYKQLFGDEYDPLWDVGKTVTDLKDFPYNWPYVREEDLVVGDESMMYKSEHKFPIVNTNSGLDLDFIANTDQDVVALMLLEQQQGVSTSQRPVSTMVDLDDKLPQTRAVPLSNSQLSLFRTDVYSAGQGEGYETTDTRRSVDASSMDEQFDDDSESQQQIALTKQVKISERSLNVEPIVGSDMIVSESSENLGIRSRSRVEVKDLDLKHESKELGDSENVLGERQTDEVGDGNGGLELEGTFGTSQQLHQPHVESEMLKSEGMEEPTGSISDQVLLPGDPLYPENWREICEDECLSEGESIPSPRSSPSNVTDFSEITEVELFVPSDAEEEPYQEYYDDAVTSSFGPTVLSRPSHVEEEEPTEEYMGESEDELESEGARSAKKRGPSLLKGKHVATSSSGSSDEDADKRQDLERTFSQIIAERKVAMADREQQLRDLD